MAQQFRLEAAELGGDAFQFHPRGLVVGVDVFLEVHEGFHLRVGAEELAAGELGQLRVDALESVWLASSWLWMTLRISWLSCD